MSSSALTDSGPVLVPLDAPRPSYLIELAERRLWSNVFLANRNLSCEYSQGILILRGFLPTYYLKQLAQNVVAEATGIWDIVNQIEIG
jgi:hypothetical protein